MAKKPGLYANIAAKNSRMLLKQQRKGARAWRLM